MVQRLRFSFLVAICCMHAVLSQQCNVLHNVTINAPDMVPFVMHASTVSQCCNECSGFIGCVGAVFDASSGSCHLKNKTSNIGSLSGGVVLLPDQVPSTATPTVAPTSAPTTTAPTPRPAPTPSAPVNLWNISLGESTQIIDAPFLSEEFVVVGVQNALLGTEYYQTIAAGTGTFMARFNFSQSLVYGSGFVFECTSDAVIALAMQSGSKAWSFSLGGSSCSSLVYDKSGSLYLSATNATETQFSALSAVTGAVLWTQYFPSPYGRSLRVHPRNHRARIANSESGIVNICLVKCYFVEASTGDLLWSFSPQPFEVRNIQIGSTAVVAQLSNSELWAFNAKTGEPLWNATTELLTLLALEGDSLYFAESYNELVAWNASTGNPLWLASVPINIDSPVDPVVKTADGIVYFVHVDNLAAIAASTGEVLWTYAGWVSKFHIISGTIHIPVANSNGGTGSVVVFDATSGVILQEWIIPNPCNYVALTHGNEVYAAGSNGIVAWVL